jgi:hypothetical protein
MNELNFVLLMDKRKRACTRTGVWRLIEVTCEWNEDDYKRPTTANSIWVSKNLNGGISASTSPFVGLDAAKAEWTKSYTIISARFIIIIIIIIIISQSKFVHYPRKKNKTKTKNLKTKIKQLSHGHVEIIYKASLLAINSSDGTCHLRTYGR